MAWKVFSCFWPCRPMSKHRQFTDYESSSSYSDLDTIDPITVSRNDISFGDVAANQSVDRLDFFHSRMNESDEMLYSKATESHNEKGHPYDVPSQSNVHISSNKDGNKEKQRTQNNIKHVRNEDSLRKNPIENVKIHLIDADALTKEAYETIWKGLLNETTSLFSLPVKKIISLEDLEDFLVKNRIYTLASGAVDSMYKLYTYAQDNEQNWYLMELLYDQSVFSLNVKLKTRIENANQLFLKQLEVILQALKNANGG